MPIFDCRQRCPLPWGARERKRERERERERERGGLINDPKEQTWSLDVEGRLRFPRPSPVGGAWPDLKLQQKTEEDRGEGLHSVPIENAMVCNGAWGPFLY